jgi:uncharacterized protein YbcC (UPF0753/DUF2309 family)
VDQITIEVSEELKAAAVLTGLDLPAAIAQVQKQILDQAVMVRMKALLEGYVQLPSAEQDRILEAVANAVQGATKMGQLQPERIGLARQLLAKGTAAGVK